MNGSRLLQSGLLLFASIGTVFAENVDPGNDGSQFAYAENLGWLNAEPSGAPGVQVGDDELSGWMWAENVGWISLSCQNNLVCGATPYGVTNNGFGFLSGYAFAENVGWISFSCDNTGNCGATPYGVTIDPATGEFFGRAWSENAGWISFASTGPFPFNMRTGWSCSPPPAPPVAAPLLTVDNPSCAIGLLSWSETGEATGYDVVVGDLATLRATAGDFAAATTACLDDNRTTRILSDGALATGQGLWYLVRGQNCGGSGTYDSWGLSQIASRDPGILSCP